jgi:L-glyceraldehyde 3-phosphate reductase
LNNHLAVPDRYDGMQYRRCGASGLKLSAISLGLWHNFGDVDPFENGRQILREAFDRGITHFDLANNYGPPPGSAEENFGRVLRRDFAAHRDELVISSKAGYTMWPGPYGDWGSRKYLVASCDQSLKRMGLEYVDIFYHHRPDPHTPLEETMGALAGLVKSGKALYVGLSNYPADLTRQAAAMLANEGVRCLIHQPRYNMVDRWIEPELLPTLSDLGIGCIAFSPLAQGLLTDRYLRGVPADSRAARAHFLRPEHITPERLHLAQQLQDVAQERGQTLAQLALVWVLRHPAMTSVLIGASRAEQVVSAANALRRLELSQDELAVIERVLQAANR